MTVNSYGSKRRRKESRAREREQDVRTKCGGSVCGRRKCLVKSNSIGRGPQGQKDILIFSSFYMQMHGINSK